MGVRAAAAPIPSDCHHSRCLERGVAGYCGSSAAISIPYLLLSGPELVGGVPLLLGCRDLLSLLWPLRLIDAPSINCATATRSRHTISSPTRCVVIVLLGSPHHAAANMN